MSIWGKVIGGVAGLVLGGPLGAIIGAVAGHAVDRIRAEPGLLEHAPEEDSEAAAERSATARQVAFSVAVVVLGAKMAKADGVVTRAEVDAFKEIFRIPPHEMRNVARVFDEAKRDASGFEPYAQQVALLFRSEPQVLEELLAGLFHIARADGVISPVELAYLWRVAAIFRLDARRFNRLRDMYASPAAPDPYTILGVARTASNDEIKAAYRRLIRENHPDLLIAKGMPQEFVDVANEKMAAINAAYDTIEKERGLK